MTPRAEAEEHLRVIRTLMERSTVYRAISAPTALIGGLLALATAGASIVWLTGGSPRLLPQAEFTLLWLGVLAVTLCVNTFFVWQEARTRHASMISPSMRLALWSILPVLLTAAVITSLNFTPLGLSLWWTLFYGLALLATAHFSPRSLRVLGWIFLLTGLAGVLLGRPAYFEETGAPEMCASVVMGSTFGLYHILYALCAWPRRASKPEPQ